MAVDHTSRRNSNTQLLEELEALSQSLYKSHTARRTASLALPRTAAVEEVEVNAGKNEDNLNHKQRRRMSLSPWRSRPKLDSENDQKERTKHLPGQKEFKKLDDKAAASSLEKKGLWNWKPIRALSHIGMQKLSCLFSVEVVSVQSLPASMNGLRLSVCVRKKEAKDGAVRTMPSRVSQGAADFEETLFIRCHVYCGTQLKFEPRPFLIYVVAVDAEELDFGASSVDLSLLIQESIKKNLKGARVRQWDASFNLSGKAKGGELVLKLGFQIMEKDGGIGIYSLVEGQKSSKGQSSSSSIARRQSKISFSVPSPKLSSCAEAWTPSQSAARGDLQGIDDLNLDEPDPAPDPDPAPVSSDKKNSKELDSRMEEPDFPEFEVVDKGIEIQGKDEVEEGHSEEGSDKRSVSSEVVKEIVHDQFHLTRLTELDSIAKQIKALESMMGAEKQDKTDEETESRRLDAEEETATREFLQMLEEKGHVYQFKVKHDQHVSPLKLEGDEDHTEAEPKVFLPDLGKGLGCVIQTSNGGYLAAMNPFNNAVARKDTPKLAMQISKALVIQSNDSKSGFDLFQRMAAIGLEELTSKILFLMPMDELKGKTAEQIAFEGIASAIISGRNKEGANSTAARTIAAVKSMATAMTTGRSDRISTGIWSVSEDPLAVDEMLAFSLQKMEAMAIEALKIQAEMAEEDAPFDVSPVNEKSHPLASPVPLEDWINSSSLATSDHEANDPETIIISAVIQLRDPFRQYEAVGGPLIALIQVTPVDDYDEDKKFKMESLHVGGLKIRTGGKKNEWDCERQRLTAMQWLVEYGLAAKTGKKGKRAVSKGQQQDSLWSISSRVMAGMWFKSMRNPDVKFTR